MLTLLQTQSSRPSPGCTLGVAGIHELAFELCDRTKAVGFGCIMHAALDGS